MDMDKRIETERLTLRLWRKEDAEALYEQAKNPEVGPPAGWPPHQSVEESREIIGCVLDGPECYAICEKGSDTPIGAAEIKLVGNAVLTECEDECELGYWLGREYWGRGYMPEACEALLKRAFTELHMTAVWCGYYEGNEKSKRVQEKLGFKHHHTNKNVEVSLLHEIRTEYANLLKKEQWEKLYREKLAKRFLEEVNRSELNNLSADRNLETSGAISGSGAQGAECGQTLDNAGFILRNNGTASDSSARVAADAKIRAYAAYMTTHPNEQYMLCFRGRSVPATFNETYENRTEDGLAYLCIGFWDGDTGNLFDVDYHLVPERVLANGHVICEE